MSGDGDSGGDAGDIAAAGEPSPRRDADDTIADVAVEVAPEDMTLW